MTRHHLLAAAGAACAIVGALAACGGSDAPPTAPPTPVGITVQLHGGQGTISADSAGTTCSALGASGACTAGGGSVTCSDGCIFNTTRATLTLTAAPEPGYYLGGWEKACAGSGTVAGDRTSGSCTITVHAGDSVSVLLGAVPQTQLTATPRDTTNRSDLAWSFQGVGGTSYECSFDGAAFAPCTSPYTASGVSAEASHTLAVRAVNGDGIADPTPALDTTFVTLAKPLVLYTFDLTPASTGALGGYTSEAGTAHYATGKFGRAIAFDTTVAGHVTLLGTGALVKTASRWTVSLWYREDVAIAHTNLIDFRSNSAGWESYHGQASATGMTTCATTYSCFTYYDAPLGVWHNLVWRYDAPSLASGGTLRVYLDGALVGTLTSSTGTSLIDATMPDAVLGMSYPDEAPPIFAVDDVRIYDTVFSEAEQCTRVIGGTWNGTACSLP